jgi:hypothetical protein
MSICNLGSDGVPAILPALYCTLTRLGPLPREELLHVCYPPALGDDSDARQTLTRWTELGLFVIHDDLVDVAEASRAPEEPEEVDWRRHLKGQLRRLVLAPENNVDLWTEESNRSADFTRGVAWLMLQDALRFDCWTHPEVEQLQGEQLQTERKVVVNDVRWNGLRSWAVVLGFAWQWRGRLQLDPATAIADFVTGSVSDNPLPVAELRARVALEFPVLDSGAYQDDVRGALRRNSLLGVASDSALSTVLSLALLTMERRGLITLENRGDAEKLLLVCPEEKPVTHVALGAGS